MSTDQGVFILGVRKDTAAAQGADGDYVPLLTDNEGKLYTTGGGGASAGDAVHVDDAAFTLGTHKGMMIMGFAGTQSVNANDAAALACDTDGALHISDGGNVITVDGTVTADLGATDNAVLDAIDAVLDTIKVDTEAIETALEGATDLNNTTADIFHSVVAAATSNHTRTVVKAAGSSGKSVYITDIVYSTAGVTTFTLHDEDDTTVFSPATSAAAGVVHVPLRTPIKLGADKDLEITTITVSSASHSITVSGYLK